MFIFFNRIVAYWKPVVEVCLVSEVTILFLKHLVLCLQLANSLPFRLLGKFPLLFLVSGVHTLQRLALDLEIIPQRFNPLDELASLLGTGARPRGALGGLARVLARVAAGIYLCEGR